ncbi:hypothetical protein [Arenibaculum sp.]|jgi:hypothetical protein|uniref:hypothetical protein n=1 Tax=Arenibaculum sp. TaxID=2865862 RepID=UPI002E14C701|nr:hypothetical protein [Arenibaculum sp.]
MKHLSSGLLLLVFSAIFLLVVLPAGLLVRPFADSMRLRRGDRLASYLNMARAPGPAPPDGDDVSGLPAPPDPARTR